MSSCFSGCGGKGSIPGRQSISGERGTTQHYFCQPELIKDMGKVPDDQMYSAKNIGKDQLKDEVHEM